MKIGDRVTINGVPATIDADRSWLGWRLRLDQPLLNMFGTGPTMLWAHENELEPLLD